MLRRVRELAPGLWVPAIWTLVTAALTGAVTEHTLLAAHVVMSALLVLFVGLSWRDMADGVLLAWRRVILAGTPLALAGTAGLAGVGGSLDAPLMAVALVGWQLVPAPALVYTARNVSRRPAAYRWGGVATGLGAAVTLGSLAIGEGTGAVVGAVLAGVGQTAGILAAVVDY